MIQQVRSALWTILALCFIQLLAVTVSAQEGSPTQKAGTAPAGQKHSDPAIHATASIPFDFWIGPEKMPAGQYVLEMIVPSVGVIRSADGKVERGKIRLADDKRNHRRDEILGERRDHAAKGRADRQRRRAVEDPVVEGSQAVPGDLPHRSRRLQRV